MNDYSLENLLFKSFECHDLSIIDSDIKKEYVIFMWRSHKFMVYKNLQVGEIQQNISIISDLSVAIETIIKLNYSFLYKTPNNDKKISYLG